MVCSSFSDQCRGTIDSSVASHMRELFGNIHRGFGIPSVQPPDGWWCVYAQENHNIFCKYQLLYQPCNYNGSNKCSFLARYNTSELGVTSRVKVHLWFDGWSLAVTIMVFSVLPIIILIFTTTKLPVLLYRVRPLCNSSSIQNIFVVSAASATVQC